MSRPLVSDDRCAREARVRESSCTGLLWECGSENARQPLYDLGSVIDVDRLTAVAAAREVDSTIAVTFLSREYANVGLNWVEAMRRLGWRNYLVIAGDRQTQRVLDALAVPCVEALVVDRGNESLDLSPQGFTQRGLAMTALKFPVVRALLRLGLDVILSDADAVWLRNPMPILSRLNVDVAFQRVVYFPKAIAGFWGFAACSGFVYFRYSAGSLGLVAGCIDEHRSIHDDQVALNLALLSAGTHWAQRVPASDSKGGRAKADLIEAFRRKARRVIRGTSSEHGLAIAALAHHQFWRHDWVDARRSEMIICHPNTPKVDSEKMKRFQELGVRYT